MSIYIIDSSVFIIGIHINKIINNKKDTVLITIPEVFDELKNYRSKIWFDLARDRGMKIESSISDMITTAEECAKKTGDISKLSKTDISLLAKALEYIDKDVIIVTDDYAVQNVASYLKIKVKPIIQKKIKKKLQWKKQCIGCGRYYTDKEVCPFCGCNTKPRK
ncbi:MAG: NOB1 family endonuclease [Methanosarcinales archaeon]